MIDTTEFKIFALVIATVIITALYTYLLCINSNMFESQEKSKEDIPCVVICNKNY
jgi:hypothetical protein